MSTSANEPTGAQHAAPRRRGLLYNLLIGLGALLLLLAALLPTVILNGVKKTPLDPAVTPSVAQGPGKIFDADSGQMKTYPEVTATRIVGIDTKASDGDVAVFQETLCLRLSPADPDAPCVDSDPAFLSLTCDRVATDRVTGEAVNDKKYSEKKYNEPEKDCAGTEYKSHEGLTYKFPFDTTADGKYMMNDGNSGGSVQAEYQGKETIKGVEVLHFKAEFPEADTKIKGVFPGTVQNTIDYWVEPNTGLIIKGMQHQVQKFENGDTAADVELTFTEDNINKNVAKAKDSVGLLNIVKLWAPLASGLLGLLLIGAGLTLRKKQRDDEIEDAESDYEYQPPAAYADR